MTEQERIEQLKITVPRVQLTTWGKIERAIGWLFGAIAVVALLVGLIAAQNAARVATCINTNLAQRNDSSIQDATAHATWARALAALLAAPRSDVRQQYEVFTKATNTYVSTLGHNQQLRDEHPLGRC
jgi:hypothetical protein